MRQLSKHGGFTLLELMTVLVIAAILVAIAVPSFSTLTARNGVDSLQSQFSSALATARTEAASRNRIISICASNNEADCLTGTWSDGWVVFEDVNADGVVDAGDNLISVFRNRGGYTVKPSTTLEFISFNSQGFLVGVTNNPLFVICTADKKAEYARGLYVNRSGLVVKTRDTDGDKIHNNPSNPSVNLSCP